MDECPLAARHGSERTHGVTPEGVKPEEEEHRAACELEVKDVGRALDEVVDERHAVSRYEAVDDVTEGSADACDEAIPSAFVQCALNAQHAHGPQGGGHHYSYDEAFYKKLQK